MNGEGSVNLRRRRKTCVGKCGACVDRFMYCLALPCHAFVFALISEKFVCIGIVLNIGQRVKLRSLIGCFMEARRSVLHIYYCFVCLSPCGESVRLCRQRACVSEYVFSLLCSCCLWHRTVLFSLVTVCIYKTSTRTREMCVQQQGPTANNDEISLLFQTHTYTHIHIPTTQIFWAKCVDILYTYKHIYICFYFNVLPFFLL